VTGGRRRRTHAPAAGRRWAAAVLVAVLAVGGCRTFPPPDPHRLAEVEPHLGRLLLVGFHGTTPETTPGLTRLLCATRVGGVLLFGRNVVDVEQVATLTRWTRDLAAACGNTPLLVAVDAEGGRVMRLAPAAGYTPTLSARELADVNDFTLTELEARRIGATLRAAGINWNLAPVVDVGYNPANPVIVGPGRSFGADPRLVAEHARAFVTGMRAAGVLTALKHFPGHGSSFDDSHLGFVDVTGTANADLELMPYRLLLAEGAVDAVMTAHVFNRKLDRRLPATLSRATITGVLRGELRWDGVVVSDDLRMGAIEQHYGLGDAAVLAVAAGVDVLIIADDRLPSGDSAADEALRALRRAVRSGRLPLERVESALQRLQVLQGRARNLGGGLGGPLRCLPQESECAGK
jgi:beta-N-acetylhexosaminidase